MKKTIVAIAMAAVAACATSSKQEQKNVSDADLGRLSREQMGPVDDARQALNTARDEEARADLRLQQAQHEVDVAKADQEAAKADQEQAGAQQKIADDNREPAQVEKARRMQDQAKLHQQTADAHVEYGNKLVDARKAARDAAQEGVKVAQAKLELAKGDALRQADIPAAQKYDLAKLQSDVNDAQKDFDQKTQKARDLDGQAMASQQRWEDLQQQLQASMGRPNAG
jgi:hypothetical protein